MTRALQYVNAGHAAPMLIRLRQNRVEDEAEAFGDTKAEVIRLDEGGPVLGLLPNARYSAGTIAIQSSDRLVVYSDGVSEAINQKEEEFGEHRIQDVISKAKDTSAAAACERLLNEVTAFAGAGTVGDDRTLLVVQFPISKSALHRCECEDIGVAAVA